MSDEIDQPAPSKLTLTTIKLVVAVAVLLRLEPEALLLDSFIVAPGNHRDVTATTPDKGSGIDTPNSTKAKDKCAWALYSSSHCAR